MAQVRVQGLWVRLEPRGRGLFRLEIGKKLFGKIIGPKQDMSRHGIEEAVRILQEGSGGLSVGRDSIMVEKRGPNTVLKARGSEAVLTPEEVSRIVLMVKGVLITNP